MLTMGGPHIWTMAAMVMKTNILVSYALIRHDNEVIE